MKRVIIESPYAGDVDPVERRRLMHNARRKRWRERNPQLARDNAKRWRDENPDRYRVSSRENWLKRYGLNAASYSAIWKEQVERCACCLSTESTNRWHIDHEHSTGRIRGIICGKCNTGIGLLGDSVEGVERALAYLRRSK